MNTKLNRMGITCLGAMLILMLLTASPSFAQDLFGEEEPMKPPLTEEQKAAGERESIF